MSARVLDFSFCKSKFPDAFRNDDMDVGSSAGILMAPEAKGHKNLIWKLEVGPVTIERAASTYSQRFVPAGAVAQLKLLGPGFLTLPRPNFELVTITEGVYVISTVDIDGKKIRRFIRMEPNAVEIEHLMVVSASDKPLIPWGLYSFFPPLVAAREALMGKDRVKRPVPTGGPGRGRAYFKKVADEAEFIKADALQRAFQAEGGLSPEAQDALTLIVNKTTAESIIQNFPIIKGKGMSPDTTTFAKILQDHP